MGGTGGEFHTGIDPTNPLYRIGGGGGSGGETKTDMVNHPPHYKKHPSGVEVIQITEHMNFCLGNAVKYILRAEHKGAQLEDLKKARWYIDREIQRIARQLGISNP